MRRDSCSAAGTRSVGDLDSSTDNAVPARPSSWLGPGCPLVRVNRCSRSQEVSSSSRRQSSLWPQLGGWWSVRRHRRSADSVQHGADHSVLPQVRRLAARHGFGHREVQADRNTAHVEPGRRAWPGRRQRHRRRQRRRRARTVPTVYLATRWSGTYTIQAENQYLIAGATAKCPEGKVITGGGSSLERGDGTQFFSTVYEILNSGPGSEPNSWAVSSARRAPRIHPTLATRSWRRRTASRRLRPHPDARIDSHTFERRALATHPQRTPLTATAAVHSRRRPPPHSGAGPVLVGRVLRRALVRWCCRRAERVTVPGTFRDHLWANSAAIGSGSTWRR